MPEIARITQPMQAAPHDTFVRQYIFLFFKVLLLKHPSFTRS